MIQFTEIQPTAQYSWLENHNHAQVIIFIYFINGPPSDVGKERITASAIARKLITS